MCDRTLTLPGSTTTHGNGIYKATLESPRSPARARAEPEERLGRQGVSQSPRRDFSPAAGEKSSRCCGKGSNLLAFPKMPASQREATRHGSFLQSCPFSLDCDTRSWRRGIRSDSRWEDSYPYHDDAMCAHGR